MKLRGLRGKFSIICMIDVHIYHTFYLFFNSKRMNYYKLQTHN